MSLLSAAYKIFKIEINYRCITTLASGASSVDMQLTRSRIATRIVASAREATVAFFALFNKHIPTFGALEQTVKREIMMKPIMQFEV